MQVVLMLACIDVLSFRGSWKGGQQIHQFTAHNVNNGLDHWVRWKGTVSATISSSLQLWCGNQWASISAQLDAENQSYNNQLIMCWFNLHLHSLGNHNAHTLWPSLPSNAWAPGTRMLFGSCDPVAACIVSSIDVHTPASSTSQSNCGLHSLVPSRIHTVPWIFLSFCNKDHKYSGSAGEQF